MRQSERQERLSTLLQLYLIIKLCTLFLYCLLQYNFKPTCPKTKLTVEQHQQSVTVLIVLHQL